MEFFVTRPALSFVFPEVLLLVFSSADLIRMPSSSSEVIAQVSSLFGTLFGTLPPPLLFGLGPLPFSRFVVLFLGSAAAPVAPPKWFAVRGVYFFFLSCFFFFPLVLASNRRLFCDGR